MRKKILFAAITVMLLSAICAIWFMESNVQGDKIQLSWDMNGAFLKDDGSEEKINVSIAGSILDTQDGYDPLDINITFPDEFRYIFSKPAGDFESQNQKHDYLPNLTFFYSFVYDRHTNSGVLAYFGLDLEKECMIVLFENAPRCYLVASQESNADPQQLLAHFENFINKLSPLVWK